MKKTITTLIVCVVAMISATAGDYVVSVNQLTNDAKEKALKKSSEGSNPMNVFSEMSVNFNGKTYNFKFDNYFVECIVTPADMEEVPIGAKITSIGCDGEKIEGNTGHESADSLYLATYIQNDIDLASDPYIRGGYAMAKATYTEEDLYGPMAQCAIIAEGEEQVQVIHSDFDITKPFEYTGNIFKVGLEIYAPEAIFFSYNTTNAETEVATTYHIDQFRTFDDVVFYYNAPYVQLMQYMGVDMGMTFEPNKLPAFTLTYFTNDVRCKVNSPKNELMNLVLSDGENELTATVSPGEEFAFENVDITKTYTLSLNGEVVAEGLSFEDLTKDIYLEIEEEEPVTYDEFYMVGTFNEWNVAEDGGRLVFVKNENGTFEAEGELADSAQFKIITPDANAVPDAQGYKWFGGVDETGIGYFLINNDLLDQPLSMVDGSNFLIEKGGKFIFRISGNMEPLTLTVSRVVVAGDVNCDGSVNAADVTALYNYILNGDETYIATSDVNNDGAINAGDVTAVYNIILGN